MGQFSNRKDDERILAILEESSETRRIAAEIARNQREVTLPAMHEIQEIKSDVALIKQEVLGIIRPQLNRHEACMFGEKGDNGWNSWIKKLIYHLENHKSRDAWVAALALAVIGGVVLQALGGGK